MRPGTLSFFATVGGMYAFRVKQSQTELSHAVVTANVVRHLGRVVTKTLPAGWFYLGCKVDVGNRILVAANQVSTTNTPQTCIAFCSSQGLAMAGVKFSRCPFLHLKDVHLYLFVFQGQECWCGSSFDPVAGTVQSAADFSR
jgi:hypothetical protein